MNRLNIQQAGGFPLETDTLDAMQTAYNIFNSLGAMNAPLGIIAGCEATGNNVANGVVYINGEVLEFRGGALAATVNVVEETATRGFENGETKIVYQTRYATFGSSSSNPNYNWSDFHRNISNKQLAQRCNHVGFIQDYYGAIENIPTGWKLCDGTNGTPDLRSRFVVGYDTRVTEYNAVGKTGGAKDVTLSATQIPSHSHSGSVAIPDHTHGVNWQMYHENGSVQGNMASGGSSITNEARFINLTNSGGGGTFTVTNNNTGGDQPHENRPPYFVLCKIMYTG